METTNNLIWFPSFKLSVLIVLTIIIETSFVVFYCISQNYTSSETTNLSVIIITANFITGLIGYLFANLRGK